MEKSIKNKEMYMYRLMNHDADFRNTKPLFDSYTLEEHNRQFGTTYTSIEEAVQDDPEYLFTEAEMKEFLEEYSDDF